MLEVRTLYLLNLCRYGSIRILVKGVKCFLQTTTFIETPPQTSYIYWVHTKKTISRLYCGKHVFVLFWVSLVVNSALASVSGEQLNNVNNALWQWLPFYYWNIKWFLPRFSYVQSGCNSDKTKQLSYLEYNFLPVQISPEFQEKVLRGLFISFLSFKWHHLVHIQGIV